MSNKHLRDTMSWPEIVDKIMKESEEEDNQEFKEWLLSKDYLNGTFFDKYTWLYLFKIYKKLKNEDTDHVELVIGKEGYGKSSIAKLEAAIVDPTFCKERIFNERLQLFQWLKLNVGNTKGKSIIIDEGILMLFSREAKSSGNVDVVKLFALIRQCNLYVIICIPKFVNIDSYIKDNRLHALKFIRHKFKLFTNFNSKGIKVINNALKKKVPFEDIKVPSGLHYNGWWSNEPLIINDLNDKEYRNIKNKAWIEFLDSAISNSNYDKLSNDRKYITIQEMINETGMSYQGIWNLIKQDKIKAIQIGKKWLIEREALNNNSQNTTETNENVAIP